MENFANKHGYKVRQAVKAEIFWEHQFKTHIVATYWGTAQFQVNRNFGEIECQMAADYKNRVGLVSHLCVTKRSFFGEVWELYLSVSKSI